MNKKVKHGTLLTVIFTVLSLLYLYPIVLGGENRCQSIVCIPDWIYAVCYGCF